MMLKFAKLLYIFAILPWLFFSLAGSAQINLTLEIDQSVICHSTATGAISSAVSGGNAPYTYNWNGGQTTPALNNIMPGIYSLTVTDANGLTANASVNLENPLPFFANHSLLPLQCGDAFRQLFLFPAGGQPPFSYQWSTGETGQLIEVSPGSYGYTITDALGCSKTGTANVAVFNSSPPEIFVEFNHVSCFGFSDGSIQTTVGGGNQPYQYQWDPPSTQASIFGLSAGTYSLSVTDQIGCNIFTTVVIEEPPAMEAFSFTVPSEGLPANGTATVNVQGGTPPFSYVWDTGDSTQTITGLPPGSYDVTVTDDNGCFIITSVEVELYTTLDEISRLQDIHLFPNPADRFLIISGAGAQHIERVSLYNSIGAFLAVPSSIRNDSYGLQIALPELPPGVYFLKITGNGLEQITLPFVKI